MAATLEDIVSPLSLQVFLSNLRARTLLLQRGTSAARYSNLLDSDALLAAIAGANFDHGKLRLTHQRKTILPGFYRDGDGSSPAKLNSLLDRGASVIVESLGGSIPKLEALCAAMREQLGEKVNAGAILTSGGGGALDLHYDSEDILVLQAEGSKRWLVHAPSTLDPVRGMREPAPPGTEPIFDEVLQAGDLLFVPAGFWHRCENGPGRSLHIGILITPPTGWHALKAVIAALGNEEAIFRKPFTRGSREERAGLEQAIKARLIEKLGQTSFAELLAGDGTGWPPAPNA